MNVMRKTGKILYAAALPAVCALLLSGCAKETADASEERHDLVVMMNVATRAVTEVDGTPAAEESAIHSLRIYAFAGGRLAGHYFTDESDMLDISPVEFLMDVTMYSTSTQELTFYAVANEKAMVRSGNSLSFSESTSESELNGFYFTSLAEDISSRGLPMFYKGDYTVDFSKDAAEEPSDPEHQGHTMLEDAIDISLERPVGKLGIFAAKPEGEAGELKITGLTVSSSGILARNYLMPQDDETLKGIQSISDDDKTLACISESVTAELAESADRQNPANYTAVLHAPYYPFENPWGNGGSWNVKGDDKGNVLRIDYTYDGEPRSGDVYLPAIERNTYYAVCCLMNNSGKITVEYMVADWDDEEPYEIEFDYPSYGPLTSVDGSYSQPEVYYNGNPGSVAGTFSANFSLTAPEGQQWQPTLLDATSEDFEVSVYQGGKLIEPPYLASAGQYTIKVRALKPENVGRTVRLGISYTPGWDPTGTSLLLINQSDGQPLWQGSTDPQAIMIKQIDVPNN